ncbi:saccharopine dehydrogenase isoform B [Chlorella sorokiniana]|uniref:Saccharopine dehydrogenase isoform B n=1 Tax=Chlorella sorokiniana TaxID=3076 RepID=A0A2P6TSB1_CHLSO|nr:saccharopine dehydrogenase isoform B [Chlorella sorokiniana]|eukprot:PRW56953.1 saccharopine dehydrogenase isoform B [Chlorella sorokiniana]
MIARGVAAASQAACSSLSAGAPRPAARQALRRPLTAAVGWRRALSLAASSAPSSSVQLTPDTDVAAAVHAACERLGKPVPEAAVQALLDNWYTTAGELAALPDETARSLGLPLRLKAVVGELLSQQEAAAESSSQGAVQTDSSAAEAPDAARSSSASSSGDEADEAVSDSDADSGLAEALEAMRGSGGEADAAAAAAWDQADLPIEQRRCPPIRRAGFSRADAPKVVKRTTPRKYALSESELTPALQAEMEALHRFLTVRFFGAQQDPISDVTARKYADHIRGMLGWLHRERGVPLDQLSLSALLPSSGREGVSLVFDYLLWLSRERDISVRTEGLVIRSAGVAAKYLYHSESKANPGRGDRPYADLEVIKELRSMSTTNKRQWKVAPRVADEEAKWISWPDYLRLCGELRRECAALSHLGKRRTHAAVATSLQRYLIFAIFSCVPDRQRTLRELEVGRTLVKDRQGRWVIRHGPGDYKTGRAYGERPPLTLSPHIYPELEAFMDKWRAALQPRHNLLFTQQNGEPFTDKSLYKVFWTTAYRLTGKKCNPHLVRDSIVTYLRGSGASERELEALALYMGHSIEEQRSTYDRRTKQQKVEPAVELLASLNARALGMSGGSSGSGSGSGSGSDSGGSGAMASNRAFDVVIWGATGFTGRLVAEHLARDYKTGVKWALAGRSKERLEKLRLELSEQYGGELKEVPILVADLRDQASMDGMAAQTRVVLSTAGPFALIGSPVVAAAVRSGCHYVDITGETPWVKEVIAAHHEEAKSKGLRIVPCCGFDSTPFDLGALLVVDHLKKRYGKQAARVLNVVLGSKGGVSGGTIASGMNAFAEMKARPELREDAGSVYSLCPADARGADGEFWGVQYSQELGKYLGPFVMQACNNRVVHRSNYLLGWAGNDFRYQESVAAKSWFAAKSIQLGTLAVVAAMSQTWLHPLLKKVLPAQGEGPSRENMLGGFFKNRVLAWSKEEGGAAPLLVQAEVGDPHRDGGYWGTSRMLLEAALCLALQQKELDASTEVQKGGVLTPASAMGMLLVDRLRNAGMTFKVLEEGQAAA